LSYTYQDQALDCALPPAADTWQAAVSQGCPGAAVALGLSLDKAGSQLDDPLLAFYKDLGLYTAPPVRLQVSSSSLPPGTLDPVGAALGQSELSLNPLQLARAAAILSSDGVLPAPHLVTSVNTPAAGWVVLPDLSQPVRIFPAGIAARTAVTMVAANLPVWQVVARAYAGKGRWLTWYLAGTLPDWKGSPMVMTLLLEEDNPSLAVQIGQAVMQAALSLSK
jgi:hypothetical protein